MVVLHWPKLFEGLICPSGDKERNGWGGGYGCGYGFTGGGEGGGIFQGKGAGHGNGQIAGDGTGCSLDGDSHGGGGNTFV
jgi:hypothetical protein